MNKEAISKAIFTAIIAGGVMIAAFYFAYVLLLVVVLGAVGIIAYLYFNWEEIFKDEEFPD